MLAQPASQLTPRPVTWLWAGRLPLGKLAILDADPGVGKSLLTVDLCARLSTGRPFPDDSPGSVPACSLILNAEDGAEDTILPRLLALGADLDRVFLLPAEDRRTGLALRLPTQTDLLDHELARTHARLVVIDPIVAFLAPTVQTSNDQSVRQALFPLAQVAERHQCVIVLIRHLNKDGGTHALYRGGGTIGFLGACRSGWLLARDPHAADRRVLAQLKNNLAAPQPSLAFSLVAANSGPPTLSWHGPCSWTADQLLAGGLRGSALGKPRQRAKDFLAAILEDGPRTSRDIWALAKEQGLSERTLQRARVDLQARAERVSVDGKLLSYWLLPGQQLPAGASPDAESFDLEPWLAPMRERFPPSTPLDND